MRIFFRKTQKEAMELQFKFLKVGRKAKVNKVGNLYEIKVYARGQK